MINIIFFSLLLITLIASFSLTALINAFRKIHQRDWTRYLKKDSSFVYKTLPKFVFLGKEQEVIFFSAICAQNLVRFCYAAFVTILLFNSSLFQNWFTGVSSINHLYDFSLVWIFFYTIAAALISFIFGDYFSRIYAIKKPESAIRICSSIAAPFLLIVFPITYIFFKIPLLVKKNMYLDTIYTPHSKAKQELINIIHEAQLGASFEAHDKKLIESVLHFRERIAREVMVPRVDVFSLPAETTIRDAARLSEGYSRTPVYRNTVDNIVGVLMYKDILNKFVEYEEKKDPSILESPIETIQKSVLYTPETKKISALLQEFRKKQVHLSIIVDEYGGTEGIVTIEDILEEIVGEIADEYDEEETLFKKQADGSWIVDARMNIDDVEEELGIIIPQDGEYDTIGGYIFHCTGSIPDKGFIIHQDQFELEVLSTSDRSVEKVKIKPEDSKD